MNPKALDLQARTQKFATAVIKFCQRLPHDAATQKIVSQLLARCPVVAVSRPGGVQSNLARIEEARELIQESHELTAIFVASRKTAQRRKAERERLQKQLGGGNRPRLPK